MEFTNEDMEKVFGSSSVLSRTLRQVQTVLSDNNYDITKLLMAYKKD